MTSLAFPGCAKQLRALQTQVAASRHDIDAMPVEFRLAALRMHRNALRTRLGRLIDTFHAEAACVPGPSTRRLRLEQVAYELAVLRLEDHYSDAQARRGAGTAKCQAHKTALGTLHERLGHWAEILDDPIAAMRARAHRA